MAVDSSGILQRCQMVYFGPCGNGQPHFSLPLLRPVALPPIMGWRNSENRRLKSAQPPPPATAASSASTVASFEESMKMIRIRFPISLILIPEKWKMENPRGKIGKKKKRPTNQTRERRMKTFQNQDKLNFVAENGRHWPWKHCGNSRNQSQTRN